MFKRRLDGETKQLVACVCVCVYIYISLQICNNVMRNNKAWAKI